MLVLVLMPLLVPVLLALVQDLGIAFPSLKGDSGDEARRVLFPVLGLRKGHDRISLTSKWISCPSVTPDDYLRAACTASYLLHRWRHGVANIAGGNILQRLPNDFLLLAWNRWRVWRERRWQRQPSRARGVTIDFDTCDQVCLLYSSFLRLNSLFTGVPAC